MAMMKSQMKGKMDKMKGGDKDGEEDEGPVDWMDYNYPKFLKIIHYSIESVPDENMIKWARLLHITFLLWVIFYGVNLLVNILGCIMNYKEFGFMPMLYSVFHAFLFIPGGL